MTQDAENDYRAYREGDDRICPQCDSGELLRRHCKTLCPRCGYVESCEDNFLPNEDTPRDA